MTDKEKTIKELKEVLDNLDITNKYRLNLIKAIEYLQEEPVSEDLNDYINELSKQFPEVSFAKLSRIAVRVAKWQQEKEYTCYEEAFEDGAKYKKQKIVDKACKWIDENATKYLVDRFVGSTRVVGLDNSIIDDFRKDMED